jgi:hypothetical protein
MPSAAKLLVHNKSPPRPPPRRITCLRCQLTGHRNLLCTKVNLCKELPHSYWVGPALLAAWALSAVAFFMTMR